MCFFAGRAAFDTCRPVIVTEPLRGFGKQEEKNGSVPAKEEERARGGRLRVGGGVLSLLSASFLMMSRGF